MPLPPSHRPRSAILACLILSLGISALGCGGADPGERPADFAITVEHVDGSVPPPAHTEWTLEVDAAGRGTIAYLPDYEGEGVPTFRERFAVDAASLDALYAHLAELDLLRSREEGENPPVGGATESATVTADGERYEIPTYADGVAPLEPVGEEIRDLAPASVWEALESRRDAYDARRYGQVP